MSNCWLLKGKYVREREREREFGDHSGHHKKILYIEDVNQGVCSLSHILKLSSFS
jgi:hypothetical protein